MISTELDALELEAFRARDYAQIVKESAIIVGLLVAFGALLIARLDVRSR